MPKQGWVDSSNPAPPPRHILELVGLGAIDVKRVKLPALERCLCGHQPGCHPEILLPIGTGRGICIAAACRKFGSCKGYEPDPAFDWVPGNQGGPVTAVKLRVGDDGKLTRA